MVGSWGVSAGGRAAALSPRGRAGEVMRDRVSGKEQADRSLKGMACRAWRSRRVVDSTCLRHLLERVCRPGGQRHDRIALGGRAVRVEGAEGALAELGVGQVGEGKPDGKAQLRLGPPEGERGEGGFIISALRAGKGSGRE
jgi:hypothetical protein